jgi:apolipoprotein N-acyltransferase
MSTSEVKAGWIARFRAVLVRERRAIAVAVVAGCGVFVSFPMFDAFPVVFFALAAIIALAESGSAYRAFWLAFVAGWVTNLGGFYWLINLFREFGGVPLPVALPAYASMCAWHGLAFAVGLGGARFAAVRGVPVMLAYPLVFTTADALWPMIFKWQIGHSQSLNHALAQSAELGGVGLISLLIAASSTALYVLWTSLRARPPRRSLAAPLVALAALVGLHSWGAWRIAQVDRVIAAAPTVSMGLVEAEIPAEMKSDPGQFRANLLRHQNMSATLEAQGAELIIWPETAYLQMRYQVSEDDRNDLQAARMSAFTFRHFGIPRTATWLVPSDVPLVDTPQEDDRRRTTMADRVPPHRGFRTPLLTGVLSTREPTDEEMRTLPPFGTGPRLDLIWNSAVLLTGDGAVRGFADKRMLMPFSETLPLARTVFTLTGISLFRFVMVAGDFMPGSPDHPLVFEAPDGERYNIGVMICYEDISGSFNRLLHRVEPDVLVNLTNDAWFGKTAEPYLHMALSTFRAIEQRTSFVRSTNSGISSYIDAVGRVRAETHPLNAETMLVDVPMIRATRTLYMRFGDWPVWLCALGSAIVLLIARSRREKV